MNRKPHLLLVICSLQMTICNSVICFFSRETQKWEDGGKHGGWKIKTELSYCHDYCCQIIRKCLSATSPVCAHVRLFLCSLPVHSLSHMCISLCLIITFHSHALYSAKQGVYLVMKMLEGVEGSFAWEMLYYHVNHCSFSSDAGWVCNSYLSTKLLLQFDPCECEYWWTFCCCWSASHFLFWCELHVLACVQQGMPLNFGTWRLPRSLEGNFFFLAAAGHAERLQRERRGTFLMGGEQEWVEEVLQKQHA